MLLKRETLEGIVEGRITLAFRRWKRPTVRAGGELRTATGVLAIDAIQESDITLDDDATATIAARLDRFDRSSRHGPWTETVLRLIETSPGVRAPDLAASLGRETQPFKREVRKLKELGLTESLEVGYRLSPRGRAWLATLDQQ